MKNTIFMLFMLSGMLLHAQTARQEINEQVWKPFIRHFSEGNTDEFMAVHSKHIIRLGLEGTPETLDWQTYYDNQKRGDERNLREKQNRTIELRFEYRSAVDSFAYETGYYRTSYQQEGKPKQDFFGKFNVILKKEKNQWKILLDSDHGGITEADFWNAQPLEATVFPIPSGPVRVLDFVKIKPGKEAEARYFYEQNWKIFREKALQSGYISYYEMVEVKSDEAGNFDLMLMTEFPDSTTYRNAEVNFQPLMRELRPGGPAFLNDLRQKDFLEYRFGAEEGNVLVAPEANPKSLWTTSQLAVGDKIIRKEVVVNASPEAVYKAWTTPEGIRRFLEVSSRIEMKIGGAYELYFAPDAPAGSKGSEGCQILSFLPGKMLTFSWSAPPIYPEIRNGLHKTIVVIQLEPTKDGQTTCTLYHHHWPAEFTGNWPGVYDYFDKAWGAVLAALKEKTRN